MGVEPGGGGNGERERGRDGSRIRRMRIEFKERS